MLLPDYRKNPSSISCFDTLLSPAVEAALAAGVLAIKPTLAILGNFGYSREAIAEDVTEYVVSGPAPKDAASSLIVDTTNIVDLERTQNNVVITGEVAPPTSGHSYFTRVMDAIGNNGVNGRSNKEWSRPGNGGRLVRNESGSGSHGIGNGNSEGSNGSGGRAGGDSNGNGGGSSAGASDRRARVGRRSSAEGSSKWTSARQTGETGGAPPPPPPPPPQIALAVDDGRPRGFPSHRDSFELYAWTTTVVGLAVFVSIAKWALDRRKVQHINGPVDICPVIFASCPTVVQNPPDMCLRPDIASVYGPSSYPTPSYLPRQGPFHDRGCERVSDGVQFNISTEEAFEILNGAARPKIHQNGADTDCGNHAPSITTPALSRPDAITLFLFSLVVYLAGYVYRLPGRRHDTLVGQHPGGTSHPSFDAQGDANVEPDNIITDIAYQQTASNTDSSGSGPSLNSTAPFIPTQKVATPTNLPRFHFIRVVDTPKRHRTRHDYKNDRRSHCQIDLSGRSSSGSSSSK